MWKAFREFAIKGNALDLAVGVIIGAAFGKIVDSLVNDIIMPPIGMVIGKMDFSSLFISLSRKSYPSVAAAKAAGAPVIAYGQFINTVISFLITAWAVFIVVQSLHHLRRKKEAPPALTRDCPFCARSIPVKAVRCPECTSDLGALSRGS